MLYRVVKFTDRGARWMPGAGIGRKGELMAGTLSILQEAEFWTLGVQKSECI